jgi:Family of unknown function (DUF695)
MTHPYEGTSMDRLCPRRRGDFLHEGRRVEAEWREFPDDFPRERFPVRMNVVWHNRQTDDWGLPFAEELREQMGFAARLFAEMELGFRSVCALVWAGKNKKEFVHYALDPREFLRKLKTIQEEEGPYPIEVSQVDDPGWAYSDSVMNLLTEDPDQGRTMSRVEFVREGHNVILRYWTFPGDFPKERFPLRMNVFWNNRQATDDGLPTPEERKAQNKFEYKLLGEAGWDFQSVLTIVRSMKNQKEFVSYTSHPQEFVQRVAGISHDGKPHPIETHQSNDPNWDYLESVIEDGLTSAS